MPLGFRPLASGALAGYATIAAPSVQLLRPIADITDGGWLPLTGSDLFAMVDETVADDADYIYSPDNPTTEQCELKYSPGVGSHTTCTSRARLEAVGADTDFDFDLVQGTTVLDSWTESVTVAEGAVTRTHVSTGISITDAADLRTRHVAREPSGSVVEEIITAALGANDESDRPLPLMATWSASAPGDNDQTSYSPPWHMDQIDSGCHLLPNFQMPPPELLSTDSIWSAWVTYFQASIERAAEHGLPLVFTGTQWERLLYDDPAYWELPAATNPNVVRPSDLVVQHMISPFGNVTFWEEIGAYWGGSDMMAQLQEWYPNPPLVIFMSNNEASKLIGRDAETNDQHFIDLYGTGNSYDFMNDVCGDAWAVRYRALQEAWRGTLTTAWQDVAKYMGYEAFGPKHYARWGGWQYYSLYRPNRIDPNPNTWDGGSPSYYLMNGNPGHDNRTFSPQVEAMNYLFMLEEAYDLNPDFWFELSCWNGCEYWPRNPGDPDCALVIDDLPGYTPPRYGGMVKFGMWLTRPRAVRDFRGSSSPRSLGQVYFDELMTAVDRVYANATLRNFWRYGQLVENSSRAHPYQTTIPTEYASVARMFMLTTDLDPDPPWAMETGLPVFVLARVIGTTPSRSWLLYAFSPDADRTGVVVTIPSVGDVTIGATIAGSYYTVAEGSLVATEVS